MCAACPVWLGECPQCGTYWFSDGCKRYGVSPVLPGSPLWQQPGTTARHTVLNVLPNVTIMRSWQES